MKEVVLIKYGGSIITDKHMPLSVDIDAIHRLNKQVSELYCNTHVKIIVGNGGGAFGHYYASKYGLYDSQIENSKLFGICVGKNGNNYLNQIIVDDLLSFGVISCSSRISSAYLQHGAYEKWIEVQTYLNEGIIPVLYGDILLLGNHQYGIISTERFFVDLCDFLSYDNKFKIRKVIICTNTNGVLSTDGTTIPMIDSNNFKNIIFSSDTSSFDVTGGMKGKIENAMQIANFCDVQIVDGKFPNSIIKAYYDEKIGTVIRKQQV